MQSLELGICLFSTSCFKFGSFPKYIRMDLRKKNAPACRTDSDMGFCFDCLSQYVSCSALKKYNGYCPTGRIPVAAYVLGSLLLSSRVQFCLWSVGKYCNKLIQSHGWIPIVLLVLLWQNASLLEWELCLSGNWVRTFRFCV